MGTRLQTGGFTLATVGWVVLAVSLFLDRANGLLSETGSNRLIGYQPTGILLVLLLAAIVPGLLYLRGNPGRFVWVVAGLWLVASALTIVAGLNLDLGMYSYSSSSAGGIAYAGVGTTIAGPGTYLSIIGANLGFVGTGLLAWPRQQPQPG